MNKTPGAKRGAGIYIAVVSVLLAICTAVLCFCFTFVGKMGNGFLCYKFSRELDLRSKGITCFDGIERLEQLEQLDVRGTALTAEQLEYISQALPDCQVMWSTQIGSQLVDYDCTSIECSDLLAEQVDSIAALTQLESADLRGSECYEQIVLLSEKMPECDIIFDVAIGGERYDSSVTDLTIGDAQPQELANLAYLPGLKSADLRGCRDYETILSLYEKMPECSFLWDGELAGVSFTSEQTLLDLSDMDVGAYDDFAADAEIVKYFPMLEKVDMCGCGFSNEQMAALNEAYPDVRFVWTVHIGRIKTWDIRTDITCFSTLMYGPSYGADEEYFKDLFMYCTDLVALDLGHNQIKDISMITNLKKLQILILTDNDIVDISPLAELKELVFLEMNMNEVENLDALAELDKLEYIHMHWNNITDASAIIGQDQLVRVLLSQNPLTKEQRDELVEEMPDTTFVYVSTVESRKIWSMLPIREAAKEAFSNWEQVENFVSWDNIIYK